MHNGSSEAIKAELESFAEVQNCEIILCTIVDMDLTDINIRTYLGSSYPNCMLAKSFLTVTTTFRLTLADGWEDTDFGKLYGPVDTELSSEVVLSKTDNVVCDPYNILFEYEDTHSYWKRADGFGYVNAAEE